MSENLPEPKKVKGRKEITENDRLTFLDLVRQGLTLKESAIGAAHPPDTFLKLRKRDPEFNEKFLEAREIGTDVLEQEARRRAIEGFRKPIIGKVEPGIDGQLKDDKGNLLYEMVYSDRLVEVLLKGRRPEYREKQQIDITNQTLNVSLEDRSAALDAVARVLESAGVTIGSTEALEAAEGDSNGGGASYQELP